MRACGIRGGRRAAARAAARAKGAATAGERSPIRDGRQSRLASGDIPTHTPGPVAKPRNRAGSRRRVRKDSGISGSRGVEISRVGPRSGYPRDIRDLGDFRDAPRISELRRGAGGYSDAPSPHPPPTHTPSPRAATAGCSRPSTRRSPYPPPPPTLPTPTPLPQPAARLHSPSSLRHRGEEGDGRFSLRRPGHDGGEKPSGRRGRGPLLIAPARPRWRREEGPPSCTAAVRAGRFSLRPPGSTSRGGCRRSPPRPRRARVGHGGGRKRFGGQIEGVVETIGWSKTIQWWKLLCIQNAIRRSKRSGGQNDSVVETIRWSKQASGPILLAAPCRPNRGPGTARLGRARLGRARLGRAARPEPSPPFDPVSNVF